MPILIWAALLANGLLCAQSEVVFETDIKPLLEKHCVRCHGPDDEQGGFRIDDRDTVMSGYVEPGDASFSDLFLYVNSKDEDEMMPPPDDGGPLKPAEITLIQRWIDEGADWPESVQIELVKEVVDEIEQQIIEEEQQADAKSDNVQLATEILGLLHPVMLHFPVALLIGGAFFALLGLRGESPLGDAAYYCLWLAAWTSILACLSGWYFAIDKDMANWQRFDTTQSIDLHRWGGIAVAVLAFLLALIAASSRRRDPYGSGALWKLGMMLLAAFTGFVAHHGGKMTHDGLHDRLFNKTNQLYQNLTGESPAAAPENNAPDLAGGDAATSEESADDAADKDSPAATDADQSGSGQESTDEDGATGAASESGEEGGGEEGGGEEGGGEEGGGEEGGGEEGGGEEGGDIAAPAGV